MPLLSVENLNVFYGDFHAIRGVSLAVEEGQTVAIIGANGAESGLKALQEVAQKLPSQIELWVGGTHGEASVTELKKTRALLIEDFEMLEQHLIRLGARF